MSTQEKSNMSDRRSSRLPSFRQKSLLTQLREYQEVQVVYCFLASLVLMSVIIDILAYLFDQNALNHDILYLVHLCNNTIQGVYAWITLIVVHSLLYPMAVFWIKSGFKSKSLYVVASIGFIVLLVVAPLKVLLSHETGLVVRFSFLMEQMRIFLKSVAFVVETVWKERRYRDLAQRKKTDEERKEGLRKDDTTSISDPSPSHHETNECSNNNKEDIEAHDSPTLVPSFRHFIYFSFAPVYVYRDSYPRNKSRDWGLLVTLSCEFICMVYILFQLQKRTALYFIKTGKEPFVVSEFSTIAYWSGLHGLWIFICIGYGMIHLWMNLIAEVMKFANRDFYHDWWMAVNIQENQQKWNRIIQAWLYEYVYKVVRSSGGSRNASAISVLIVSGICHEYVVGFTLGVFLPILSCFQLLFFPLHLIFKAKKRPNDGFPVADCIGHYIGILVFWTFAITGYSLEYYARQNCPVAEGITPNSWKDFFTPRAISCVSFS